MTHPPINIFSGEKGLGGALTNPTELARRKGGINKQYSLTFKGRLWADVESGYHVLAQERPDEASRDTLLVEMISAKFRQYPELFAEVESKGGRDWLAQCSHMTGARTERAQSWEGIGMDSRFIRLLVAGYDSVHRQPTEQGQNILF